MSRAAVALAVIGGVGLASWWAARNDAAANSGSEALKEIVDVMNNSVMDVTGISLLPWQKVAARPENAIYVALLHAAEARHGIPSDLLVRLAYQESRFRQDIITGKVVSSAGAVGIMQIVPRWHPNVNPLDPSAAINYAANYLASLKRQFGSWQLALQAYNWGPGNLKKYLTQGGSLPAETSNYSSQILADIGGNIA